MDREILYSILIIGFLISSLVLIGAFYFSGATRYEFYSYSNGNAGAYASDFYAQTFTVGTNGTNEIHNLSGITFLTTATLPPINFELHLVSVNATGGPDATNVLSSNRTINLTEVASGIEYNVSMPAYILLANTQYAIIFNNSHVGATEVRLDSAGNYGGGMAWESNSSNSPNFTIVGGGTYDFWFQVWGIASGPTIIMDHPINKTYNYQNISLNVSSTSVMDTWIWTNDSSLNNHTFTPNTTIFWGLNQHTLKVWANSTAGLWASASVIFSVEPEVYHEFYPNISYNGSTENFGINLTFTTAPTNGKFFFNGTEHTVNITNTAGSNWSLNRTIVLNETGTKNFYFSYDIGSINFNTTVRNLSVSSITWGLCSATLTVPYANFTFKDEGDSSAINATLESAVFYYWLGADQSQNNSLSFADSGQNYSYAFCFTPQHETINVDLTFQYDASGYVQRNYKHTGNYTNTTTEKTLYLLSSTDGLYVTYQVVSGSQQPISGVYANATRSIGGTTELISSGYTGDDGGITFWLNPDYPHTLTFEKEGYNSAILSHTPTQSSYTVELSSVSVTVSVSDYSRGISYVIEPTNKTLRNESTYTFNFTISSSYWSLDEYGFVLKNSSGSTLGSNSSTVSSGGTTSFDLNTANHSHIIMEYYWYTNSTYSNGTTSWYITDTVDYGYSIWTFFKHLKTYTDDGIFGLSVWSRTLIIFLIIFGITGAISYFSGVYSPGAVLVEIFVLTALFDVGLGMIPTPINAVTHFATIFVALIMTGYLIMEWYR